MDREIKICVQAPVLRIPKIEKPIPRPVVTGTGPIVQNLDEMHSAELLMAKSKLAFENHDKKEMATELTLASKELIFQYKEKGGRGAELIIANDELIFLNIEKEKHAAELAIAYTELAFQNQEKEDRAAELVIANKELVHQNNEKENRASELAIANRELAFQNQEKEKRAAELIIANKELIFQNEEKDKRASELAIANMELLLQNNEKESLAAELILANKELLFQNSEKENRAAELVIANNKLIVQNREKERRAKELAMSNNHIKRAEEQLIEANDELEAFTYSVSHDLRAPLRAIHGYTKMLIAGYGDALDAEGNRFMGNISENAKRMGQLIDDLLAFSRVGRTALVKKTISMATMVTDICDDITQEQHEQNIEFRIGELLPVQADMSAVKQIWLNLISNAVKYSRHSATSIIEIGSDVVGNEIIYHIKDNGAGFDMRYADKLFGVFQRLHSDEEFEGTGVGLALVQRLIFKHDGRVWGEGKVNGGAIFYFTLKA